MEDLEEYGRVPIAFQVESVLDLSVRRGGLGGFALQERTLVVPFEKDHDAIPGNCPTDWIRLLDLTNWGILSAYLDGQRVGGAAVAFRKSRGPLLAGRNDAGILWDLRVSPRVRRNGIGASLFASAGRWAVARGCRLLEVETQNINVPACRFYASRGCLLSSIQRFAYRELPEEVRLVWHKHLEQPGAW